MKKLPLDDPRWMELNARGAMTFVMREMDRLVRNPGDYGSFSDFWPHLCSEGTTWDAAFAVAPYLIEFAHQAPEEKRYDYALVIGLMEAYSDSTVPEYLQAGWEQAKSEARVILQKYLWLSMDAIEDRYFLAAVAALKGYPGLSDTLMNLDCCEACSTQIEG